MDKATVDEKKRKTAATESKKRPPPVPNEQADAKRPRLEPEVPANTSASFLAAFDFTSLPATLITELIVANLEAFPEPTLIGLVNAFRESRGLGPSAPPAAPSAPAPPTGPKRGPVTAIEKGRQGSERVATPQGPQAISAPVPTPALATPPPVAVKDEPVDPLQMDIDQDEIEYEPDRLNEEVWNVPPLMPSDSIDWVFSSYPETSPLQQMLSI